MNRKVTKNIQQLVAQRRAKRIETVRNEVITVNLKDARAKQAESTGAKQVDSPTTPTPVAQEAVETAEFEKASHYSRQDFLERMNGAPVTDTIIEKSEAPPSPWADFTPPTAVDITDVPVKKPTRSRRAVDVPDVPVKKPTRSRSRSKPKAKK